MTERRHRADARHDLLVRLQKRHVVGQRHHQAQEQVAVVLALWRDPVAAFPFVEFALPDDIARIGKGEVITFTQPRNMVRMNVGKRDHVDVFRAVARFRQQGKEMPRADVAARRAVAGVKQDELAAGIDEGQRERVLHRCGGQEVGVGQCRNGCRILVEAERRLELAHHGSVEDRRHLKFTKLETMHSWAMYAEHGRSHGLLLQINSNQRTFPAPTINACAAARPSPP